MSDKALEPSGPLVEGVDYIIEEGRYIFTAAFLLRRGTCCGSGCRNCPYDRDIQRQAMSKRGRDAGLP